VIAFDIRYYDSIGSTNDEAMRLARDGAAHGTVVCAREQTAGRGRLSRQWHSPAGNLYLSIVLRLDAVADRVAQISFVTALAVADTVDHLLPGDVRAALKWPNDVLIRGAKVAGILIEAAGAMAIVGVGVNLRHAPADARYPVTTLAAECAAPLDDVLHALLDSFARWFATWRRDGFPAIRTAWLPRAHPPGSPLRVAIGDSVMEGRFAGLADDGALLLETADGPVRFVAGDVVLVR
jgi:BirA family biotin operon repressor/biotin-[acetyl-CoA-carboxylase] ligase